MVLVVVVRVGLGRSPVDRGDNSDKGPVFPLFFFSKQSLSKGKGNNEQSSVDFFSTGD
jgi:hypothetical protein